MLSVIIKELNSDSTCDKYCKLLLEAARKSRSTRNEFNT